MTDYRYGLIRHNPAHLSQTRPRICWVMLNPSTADDKLDDQTIRKVTHISWREGFAALIVVNLFAARTTIPDELPLIDNPGGPFNPGEIRDALSISDAVVFAWGAWWSGYQRRRNSPRSYDPLARPPVERWVADFGLTPLCLGKTKHGDPKHPCRLPNDTPLVPF